MKKSRKTGRPKLAPGEAKQAPLQVRYTAEQRQALEAAAAADDVKLSEFVRRASLEAATKRLKRP